MITYIATPILLILHKPTFERFFRNAIKVGFAAIAETLGCTRPVDMLIYVQCRYPSTKLPGYLANVFDQIT